MSNNLGFIWANWGIISVIMYSFSLITIIVALLDKVDVMIKIFNIFIITSIPIVGCCIYFVIRYKKKGNMDKKS